MLLMSVTLAVAAVRLARMNTLVQQMAATEALAAVDTICVDKTGTLTDGTLEPGLGRGRRRDAARGRARGARPLRALGRRAEPDARRRSPSATRGKPERVVAEVPFSSAWKWSGADARRAAAPRQLRAGRARRPRLAPAPCSCRPSLQRTLERAHRRGPARGRLRRGSRAAPERSGQPAAAAARGPRAGRARGAAALRRRRDDRVHARAERGPEADLGRRPPDRDRGRARGRRAAGRRGDRGARAARRQRAASPPPPRATRSSAASRRSRRRRWSARSRSGGASRR